MSDRNAVYFTISDITQTQRFETKLYDPPEGFFKYFRESHARGLKDETIKALAPGATLKRRFTIDQPEMVFLDLKITFKRKPFPLPELMLGNSQLIVSEKIKEVIEANDDETH